MTRPKCGRIQGARTVQDVACGQGVWRGLGSAGYSVSRRVAVIVEPAQVARIYPPLMSAYGLTFREQEVTRLVLPD
jgi:TRAP-type C4-dicarboxylate transport system permease large subunit